MWSRLCALATILSVVTLGGALIEEIRMPNKFQSCLEKYTLKSNGSSATAESIDYYCIQKHRMQLIKPFFTPKNISADTNKWISELLRMSEVDSYEQEQILRFKRQAGNQPIFPFPVTATQKPIILNRPSTGQVNQQSTTNQATQNIPKMTFPSVQTPTQIQYQVPAQQTQPRVPQALPRVAQPQSNVAQPQPRVVQPQPRVAQPQPRAQSQPRVAQPQTRAQPQPRVQPQGRVLRIRKEYRRLTDQERNKFHRAILMLKADTSIQPNRYDALGLVHMNLVNNIHHGASFLPWHRTFITIFENALRQKIPDVTLPYWDSTLDEAMVDPTQSILFSNLFAGNGNGLVTSGPFAYFQTPSGPLIRNIGQGTGSLFSREEIMTILTRRTISEILEPNAETQFNLENYHGDVHTWLGGEMEPMETSAFDPLFYLHHCFVDYVWEIFRTRQRALGIDPTRDYPQNYGEESHSPFARMGFGDLRNSFGLSDMFTTQIYTYEQNPSCSMQVPNCRSNYLNCDLSQGVSLCIPVPTGVSNVAPVNPMVTIDADTLQNGNGINNPFMNANVGGVGGTGMGRDMFGGMPPPAFGRKKRSLKEKQMRREARKKRQTSTSVTISGTHTCTGTWLSFSSQNTFEVDGVSDTRQWVFIPVRIISKRSPEHRKFQAFPIFNGFASKKNDIYNPETYPEISPYFSENVMPSSPSCRTRQADRTVGRVHIRSNGLNYVGNYEEYVVVDLRQAFTESTTYIALKEPHSHMSEVLLTAYDSCGRRCKPYCRNSDPKKPGYHRCSGAIRVTDQSPWMYGKNYGDSVRISWKLNDLDEIPELRTESVFIQFYCDHKES